MLQNWLYIKGMENKIKHVGIVEAVEGECVKVRISQSSACASCKVSKQCNASEKKDKTIDVYTANPGFIVGDKVVVTASFGVGGFAVLVGMVIPMLVVLVMLFLLIAVGLSDLAASLLSLVSLVPYYLLLVIFRNRINRKVTFDIEACR